MNDKILVIEDDCTRISKELKCSQLKYSFQSKDRDIYLWLIANLDMFNGINTIIICCSLGRNDAEYMGLYIGLHIRLTRELGEVRFLPIIFLSDFSKEDILSHQVSKNKEKSALLLFTKGSYLTSSFNIEIILSQDLIRITEEILVHEVISNLNITNTNDSGHQLANEWGAFRLAKFAGCSTAVEKPSSLFFMIKDAMSNNEVIPDLNTIVGLLKCNCKALLIDDNAHIGWYKVLNHILKLKVINPSNVCSLKQILTFEDAKTFSDYHDYDIIFLDLRLLEEENQSNKVIDIQDFSGTKILNKIKNINRGIQVIILTASNKIWNIDKLMQLGANGYYIKESPEYTLSSSFSKDNYKELIKTINACLERKPLIEIFSLSKNIEHSIGELINANNFNKEFGEQVIKYLQLANNIVDSGKLKDHFAISYITLFKCLELIGENYLKEDISTRQWIFTDSIPLKQYVFNKEHKHCIESEEIKFKNNLPSLFEKLAGLSFQILLLSDADVECIHNLILGRNKYIHPDGRSSFNRNVKTIKPVDVHSLDGYFKLMKSLNIIFEKLSQKP